MSITENLTKLNNIKADIKQALYQKGQTVNEVYDTYPTAINNLQTIQKNKRKADCIFDDVLFIDYDGSVVASYTLAQARALTALPTPPTHAGLTFYGWNWTLEDIQALTSPLDVGAIYNPTDGKTHVYFEIPEFPTDAQETYSVSVHIIPDDSNKFTIDWGDNSPTTTDGTASTLTTVTHTYNPGNYEMTISSAGTFAIGNSAASDRFISGSGSQYIKKIHLSQIARRIAPYGCSNNIGCTILTLSSGTTTIGNTYALAQNYSLKQIILPVGSVTVANYFAGYCYACEGICLARTNTTLNQYCFNGCYGVRRFTIPDKITTSNANAFYISSTLGLGVSALEYFKGSKAITFNTSLVYAFGLKKLIFPEGTKQINTNIGNSTSQLVSVTFPSSLTTLGSSFRWPASVYTAVFLSTTPPTITATGINNLPSSTKIIVPSASLNSYKTASNWQSKASQIYAADDE